MANTMPVEVDRESPDGPTKRPRPRPPWLNTVMPDVIAGISVAFVLIPQSLAYARIAGLPPEHGLYAAALAPIAASMLQSSPYLQTGPTAGTSLLVLGTLSVLAPIGGPEYIALAALMAVLVGVWRVLLGLIKGGPLAYLMSQPVLEGFSIASSALIAASQLPAVLGMESKGSPIEAAWAAVREPGAWAIGAAAFALATALAMVLGKRIHPLVPGILIAATGTIAVSTLIGYDGPTVGPLPAGLPPITVDLPWSHLPALLLPSLVIALVGFAEPSAIARKYAAADRHHWNPNREMISQGVANIAAGFGGGYAAGGSFSRTALNKLAGARTRLSGAVTGLTALAFLPMSGLLAKLPIAVLGAAVIVAVIPLLTLRPILRFWKYSRPQALLAVVTLVITLALAPRIDRAVLIGVGLAIVLHLWRELHVQVPNWTEGEALHLRPRGVLFFASAPPIEEAFTRLLEAHPDAQRLVLHCDGLGRIDLTGALALRAVLDDARSAELDIELLGVPPQALPVLSRVLPDLLPGTPPLRRNVM